MNTVKFADQTVEDCPEVLILIIKSLLIVNGYFYNKKNYATLLLYWLNNDPEKNT